SMDGVVLAGLEFADGRTYQELLAGEGVALGELLLGLDGFSLAWSEGAEPDCGCGTGAAGGGLWLLLLAAGAGVLRCIHPTTRRASRSQTQ
ncbi:MAG TPA: hypothetical protein P5076_18755, partial [Myxococcota bacterium]|nr:hypothetical protein [Myxococcota bacterium]